jgi:hypothetical protein
MKYQVTDIMYDTDGKKINLPAILVIDVPDGKFDDDSDIEQYISDEISNITGFCHTGFSLTPELNY